MRKVIREFKEFMLKGNAIDMAVGIIIGAAFKAVVSSLAKDIIYPLINTIINTDFSKAKVELVSEVVKNGEVVQAAINLNYGNLIKTILDLFIIALSLFVTLRVAKAVNQKRIKSTAKWLIKMKEKHPEYFEEDDKGINTLYKDMVEEYPHLFGIVDKEPPKKPTTEQLLQSILEELQKNKKGEVE